jgi:3-oxoacyl-[acyl-carrier protein] reductase
MNTSLHSRRALVCGASQGIGLAAAQQLAALGASVTLVARDVERLKHAAHALPLVPGTEQSHRWFAADFSKPETVREAIHTELSHQSAAGPYTILINNTGGPPGGPAIDAKIEEFTAAFTAHVLCNQILAQALVPAMKEAKFGRIVNIISTSVKAPIPNLGVSNTIRGAVASWAKTLATELGPFGITVNNVLPGFTETERLASLVSTRASKSNTSPDQVKKDMLATIPAGRFAKPDEVGAAIAFLCTPAAGYINGINLPVDGGRLPTL